MKQFIAAAGNMSVTFHWAFDMCADAFGALEQIIDLGCDRILTSGCASLAETGISGFRLLQQKAGLRITLMAGAGIDENNIKK